MSLPDWWPIYWIHNGWQWGWKGRGWNCLSLGKVRIWL